MFLGGLTPKSMCADDDYKLLDHGIGFTNVVMRATRGSANLTRKEIEEGKLILGAFLAFLAIFEYLWSHLEISHNKGFGFTNVVKRATRGIANRTKKMIVFDIF